MDHPRFGANADACPRPAADFGGDRRRDLLGAAATQAAMQFGEALLEALGRGRVVEGLEQRVGDRIGLRLVLDELGDDEGATQDVGQSHIRQ